MPPSTPDRRTLLELLAAAGALALAGCSGDGGETTAPETTDSGATPGTDTSAGSETTDDETPVDPEEVDPEASKSAARTLVTRWANGEYEAMREPFTERMRGAVTVDELRDLWEQLVTDKGAFVSVTRAEYTTSQGYGVVVLTGQFTEGQQRFVVTFDGEGRVAGLQVPPPAGEYQAPAYVDRSTFTEQEVSIQATDSCSLGATLSMPEAEESVPGVVLVHGSGPHDRDETIGPNEPFRDLSWGLASRGIAVLRYDKRTAGCSVTEPTLDSVVTDDALAAVDVLRNADRVADDDVVVVGHSLGGMVAPRIAARGGTLAGIAMLAAPARPLADLVVVQNEYLADLDGTVTDAERAYLEDLRQQMERAQSGDMGPEETVLGQGRSWWNSLATYDQVETAEGLSLPTFLLQGGRDYQVDPEADFGRWRDALGGRDSVRFDEYPSLDHLFMPGEGPSRPADYYEQDNVAETVVSDLAGWIDGVAGDAGSE
ncbi:alpha/beta hydrolase [Halorientalis pallida]|uniref:Alpha/beta fold hydrolase n=1 Tax=Halorientalis pallida TaxID=2479928 RepID=A0A498KUP6_9EURY|nr:alpha/beta fold hydrolase [Halorientalis pallida]RXK48610.1 alpha/beta fold hydrolase [Halorientalis pallida]